jgi:hypothetical protein
VYYEVHASHQKISRSRRTCRVPWRLPAVHARTRHSPGDLRRVESSGNARGSSAG